MKQIAKILIPLLLFGILTGCAPDSQAQIAATTLPVYEFTSAICQGTPLTVTRLVTESVSCLHDYTLTVRQMRAIEGAELVVISGGGLEEFMEDALEGAHAVADASAGIELLPGGHHHHKEEEHDGDGHHHDEMDAHIWLSPENAGIMAQNIRDVLIAQYPEYADTFRANEAALQQRILAVREYGNEQLSQLATRGIITFHDGFSYLAQAFDLEILEAIEEESGSEASAQELIGLIDLVEGCGVQVIFTETNGSDASASIIAAETGVKTFTLDMAMAGDSWFDSMYHNIDTLKEALSE